MRRRFVRKDRPITVQERAALKRRIRAELLVILHEDRDLHDELGAYLACRMSNG